MSIVNMFEARDHLRIIGADLDPVIATAIAGAEAEVDGFIGGEPSAVRWPDPENVPGDIKSAALLLVRLHFEEGDPVQAESWRAVAQKLLFRYRVDSGLRAA